MYDWPLDLQTLVWIQVSQYGTVDSKWETFFHEANIPEDEVKQYFEIFHTNQMMSNALHELTKEDLSDLGIIVLGNIKNILRKAKASSASLQNQTGSLNIFMKAPAAKLPQLYEDMTLPQFRTDTAFNRTSPFPAMSMPPAHIHLNENAKPYTRRTPIPISFHWKKEVKESLDRDVERGIIAPVPIGTPVEWCSPMVVTAKKNGKPRRTIDLQCSN